MRFRWPVELTADFEELIRERLGPLPVWAMRWSLRLATISVAFHALIQMIEVILT